MGKLKLAKPSLFTFCAVWMSKSMIGRVQLNCKQALEGRMEQPVAIIQPLLVGSIPEILNCGLLLGGGDGGTNDGALFGGESAGCVLRHGEQESLSSTSNSFF